MGRTGMTVPSCRTDQLHCVTRASITILPHNGLAHCYPPSSCSNPTHGNRTGCCKADIGLLLPEVDSTPAPLWQRYLTVMARTLQTGRAWPSSHKVLLRHSRTAHLQTSAESTGRPRRTVNSATKRSNGRCNSTESSCHSYIRLGGSNSRVDTWLGTRCNGLLSIRNRRILHTRASSSNSINVGRRRTLRQSSNSLKSQLPIPSSLRPAVQLYLLIAPSAALISDQRPFGRQAVCNSTTMNTRDDHHTNSGNHIRNLNLNLSLNGLMQCGINTIDSEHYVAHQDPQYRLSYRNRRLTIHLLHEQLLHFHT